MENGKRKKEINGHFLSQMISPDVLSILTALITIIFIVLESYYLKKMKTMMKFNLDTIRVARSDFSDSNKLGEGGFGTVYQVR